MWPDVDILLLGSWSAACLSMAARKAVRVDPSLKAAEDPGFDSHLRRDFFGVESY